MQIFAVAPHIYIYIYIYCYGLYIFICCPGCCAVCKWLTSDHDFHRNIFVIYSLNFCPWCCPAMLLLLSNKTCTSHTYMAHTKFFLHDHGWKTKKVKIKFKVNNSFSSPEQTHPQSGNWLTKYNSGEKNVQHTMWNCATNWPKPFCFLPIRNGPLADPLRYR